MKELSPNSLHIREQVSVIYSIVLEERDDISLEAILNPTYWQHHSRKLRPGDKVEVRTEGNLFYAELFVMDVGHMAVKMKLLFVKALQDTKEALNAIEIRKDAAAKNISSSTGYIVKWVSPTRKWGVKRDGQEGWARDGFAEKADAHLWAAQDMKAMAA